MSDATFMQRRYLFDLYSRLGWDDKLNIHDMTTQQASEAIREARIALENGEGTRDKPEEGSLI